MIYKFIVKSQIYINEIVSAIFQKSQQIFENMKIEND